MAGLEAESRAQVRTLLPLTLGGPALLLVILLPLALSMARRIDDAGAERSALLRHAVAASALERRRIAGDLHDGVVQDLAGIGYALPAIRGSLPEGPDSDDARQKLDRVTEIVKRDVAALRSVITDIYPPDLHEGGLVPASQLLLNEVRYAGIDVEAHIDPTVTRRRCPPTPRSSATGCCGRRYETWSGTPGPPDVSVAASSGASWSSRWLTTGRASTPALPRQRVTSVCVCSKTRSATSAVDSPSRRRRTAARESLRASPSDGHAVMIRILVADDHEVLRWGLVQSLSGEPDMVVVGEADEAGAAVAEWERLHPTCSSSTSRCLVEADGSSSTGALASRPDARVVILSAADDA